MHPLRAQQENVSAGVRSYACVGLQRRRLILPIAKAFNASERSASIVLWAAFPVRRLRDCLGPQVFVALTGHDLCENARQSIADDVAGMIHKRRIELVVERKGLQQSRLADGYGSVLFGMAKASLAQCGASPRNSRRGRISRHASVDIGKAAIFALMAWRPERFGDIGPVAARSCMLKPQAILDGQGTYDMPVRLRGAASFSSFVQG